MLTVIQGKYVLQSDTHEVVSDKAGNGMKLDIPAID